LIIKLKLWHVSEYSS